MRKRWIGSKFHPKTWCNITLRTVYCKWYDMIVILWHKRKPSEFSIVIRKQQSAFLTNIMIISSNSCKVVNLWYTCVVSSHNETCKRKQTVEKETAHRNKNLKNNIRNSNPWSGGPSSPREKKNARSQVNETVELYLRTLSERQSQVLRLYSNRVLGTKMHRIKKKKKELFKIKLQ